jgi:hypothetical protein
MGMGELSGQIREAIAQNINRQMLIDQRIDPRPGLQIAGADWPNRLRQGFGNEGEGHESRHGGNLQLN